MDRGARNTILTAIAIGIVVTAGVLFLNRMTAPQTTVRAPEIAPTRTAPNEPTFADYGILGKVAEWQYVSRAQNVCKMCGQKEFTVELVYVNVGEKRVQRITLIFRSQGGPREFSLQKNPKIWIQDGSVRYHGEPATITQGTLWFDQPPPGP